MVFGSDRGWGFELIAPLTRRKKDGTVYLRPDNVEPLLTTLAKLPRSVLVERSHIRDRKNADYVPSECLLHFIRASRSDNSDAWFEQLYKVLVERVRRALPRVETSGDRASLANERIRNAVFDRFVELVAKDRREPDNRLDFFEVRFDLAIKRLRVDAQERVWGELNRTDSMDEDTGGVGDEAAAVTSANPFDAESPIQKYLNELRALRYGV